MLFLAPKWAQQQGYSAFTRKRVISFFWFLAWSYNIVKGIWWPIPFFLENFKFWDFAYWRPSICEKNGFFVHPLALQGWHWSKLSLSDLFITMKWLLTYLENICSFRLYIGSIYRHGHGQACQGIKVRNFTNFFHRLKMAQFAKLTCLNRQIPIFWKFSHLQDVLSPDLVIFQRQKFILRWPEMSQCV